MKPDRHPAFNSRLNHEQHIPAASWRSRLESQWQTPNFDPRGFNTSGRIKLRIGSINYLVCLTKRIKFHICTRLGVAWVMGWNIRYLGFFKRLSSLHVQVTRRAKPPRLVSQNICSHARKWLWGVSWYWTIYWDFRGKKSNFGAPDRKSHYKENCE